MKNKRILIALALLVAVGWYLGVEYVYAPTATDVIFSNHTTVMSDTFSLTSSAFVNGGLIPSLYTCDGDNIPPPLTIAHAPAGTRSFVLVMDDPDIPQAVKDTRGINKFDHWALYNIPADTVEIHAATDARGGENGLGELHYTGPCPPPQYEPTEHRYYFRLYALSGTLSFIKAPTLDELETAATGMMLEKAELMGRYHRQTTE